MNEREHVCIIGMGRVGLPLAAVLLDAGHRVTGVDTSSERRAVIRSGEADAEEPGLAALVVEGLTSGMLELTETIPRAQVYIIALPSIESFGKAACKVLASVCEQIARKLAPGALVLHESTTMPGVTRREVLDALTARGWVAGEDVFVAHSPERVLPGAALRELVENARVIGGATPACGERARVFYKTFIRGEVRVTGLEEAELTKLVENSYRDVNIALANELARLGKKLDVDMLSVMRLANTHPRVNVHQPGTGVGGRCVPLATRLLGEFADHEAPSVLKHARQLNLNVPRELAAMILEQLPRNPRVGLLGVAYKGNIADTSESPSAALYHGLARGGAHVMVHDPFVTRWDEAILVPMEMALQEVDALVFATAHDTFRELDPLELTKKMHRQLVFDLCDVLDAERWQSAGFRVLKRGQRWRAEP